MSALKTKSGNRVKSVILAVAIAIIFALFVGFGINVFYKEPKWDDYCTYEYRGILNTSESCEAAGGKWNSGAYPKPVEQNVPDPGYCDQDYYCRQGYDQATEFYNKNVFIVTLLVGIITIIVSVILKLTSVSSGLMGGGVITIIYGVLRYWQYSTDVLRFGILGIVLAILIWIGYKKLSN